MEIAQTIIQLSAHKGVLEAEIARIDADIGFLSGAASRYQAVLPTDNTGRVFSEPVQKLSALRRRKERLAKDIRQQLELFQLHHASGAALLQRLARVQNSGAPIVNAPVNVTVSSDILASGMSL